MNFTSTPKSAAIDIDLTPLINIVFLMLIFFMLAGTLKKGDPIQAAQMENAAAVDEPLLIIVVKEDGELLVEGQIVKPQALSILLANTMNASTRIALKPDARLPAHKLLALNTTLRDSGFSEVTLIVESP